MKKYVISKSNKMSVNSKKIPVLVERQYSLNLVVRALEGEVYSAYVAVVLLDNRDAETVRYLRYVRRFDGTQAEYSIRFTVPKGAQSALIVYRINKETAVTSGVAIFLPEIESLELKECEGGEPDAYDVPYKPKAGKVAAPVAGVSAYNMVQNYEDVWDSYSRRFDHSAGTKGIAHLGEEWGTQEHTSKIFTDYILPHLKPDSTVGELGVGGGKYSILVAPCVQKLYGIDISTEMLNRAIDRLRKEGLSLLSSKTDGTKINLPNGILDVFYSIDSSVHIFPYDLYTYCKELGRVLKPGGKGIIEFADWDLEGSFKKFAFDYEVLQRTGKLNPGAFGFITKGMMRHFLESSGMSIVDCQPLSKRTSLVTFVRGKK